VRPNWKRALVLGSFQGIYLELALYRYSYWLCLDLHSLNCQLQVGIGHFVHHTWRSHRKCIVCNYYHTFRAECTSDISHHSRILHSHSFWWHKYINGHLAWQLSTYCIIGTRLYWGCSSYRRPGIEWGPLLGMACRMGTAQRDSFGFISLLIYCRWVCCPRLRPPNSCLHRSWVSCILVCTRVSFRCISTATCRRHMIVFPR